MKIHQVCYFLALCEERSFTWAAKRCGVAQPSLTRAIQQLEHEFNGQLFERSKSAVRLTNLGSWSGRILSHRASGRRSDAKDRDIQRGTHRSRSYQHWRHIMRAAEVSAAESAAMRFKHK